MFCTNEALDVPWTHVLTWAAHMIKLHCEWIYHDWEREEAYCILYLVLIPIY